jgi:hypothetical protein
MLNNLTVYDFQDAFKSGRSTANYFEGDGGQQAKVSFSSDGSISLEKYG